MIPIAASAALSAASSLASVLSSAMSSSTSKATSGTSATSPSSASGTAAKSGNTVDQADFMQLLVAQLQNQDPLNPLDSANFSAQLAQFSSLQQLTEINASLKKNGGTSGAGGGLDAVGFLGKQVEGVSSAVSVTKGAMSTLDYTLSGRGTVHAQIVNASGKTVASDLVVGTQDAGAHTLDLSKISNLPQLTDGTYTVKLAVVDDATGKASAVDTLGGGIVTGIDLSGDTPTLLIGSRRISLGDVRQVNEPTSGS